MSTAVRNLLELELRVIHQRTHEALRTLGTLRRDGIETLQHLGAECALDLAETEVVGPEPIDVEIHVTHSREPVALAILFVRAHAVMTQAGNQRCPLG